MKAILSVAGVCTGVLLLFLAIMGTVYLTKGTSDLPFITIWLYAWVGLVGVVIMAAGCAVISARQEAGG